jgi:hypothetical protein
MNFGSNDKDTKVTGRRWVQRRYYLLLKGLIACGSLAALTLSPLWELLLFSKYTFHHPQPSRNDYLSGLALIALLVSVLGFSFYCLRFLSTLKRKYVGLFLLFISLGSIVNHARVLLGENLPPFVATAIWFKLFPFLLGIKFLVFARKCYLFLWKLILICFPFLFLIFAKLCVGFFNNSQAELTKVYANIRTPAKRLHNRVVWLIFDELDYRLTFPERPNQLLLPNFDRLIHHSFNFTNAVPPARATILSVPSLIDGLTYNVAYPTSPNRLILSSTDSEIAPWGTRSNIFTDVFGLGGRCAVVGWYLPYSRIFRDSVYFTHWVAFSSESFIGLGGDLYTTIKTQIIGLVPLIRQTLHRQNQTVLEQSFKNVVTNLDFDLCFIHIPAPHLPALNQKGGKIFSDDVDGYFGNLKVADGILGSCMDMINNSPSAQNTTLIVSSDHPWRTSSLYDLKVDSRVPFIVHFPRQTSMTNLGAKFQTVRTRKLIFEILGKESVIDADAGKNLLYINNFE